MFCGIVGGDACQGEVLVLELGWSAGGDSSLLGCLSASLWVFDVPYCLDKQEDCL